MFGALRDEVERLDIPIDGDAIAELFAIRDRLDAKLSAAVGVFDREGLYDLEGRTTMTAWLKSHAPLTSSEAHRVAMTARHLRQFPVTQEAWEEGELTGAQVATVLATVRSEHRELFAEHEAEIVPTLSRLDSVGTRSAMNYWTAHAEALVDPEWTREPERTLRAARLLGERVVLEGDLDPDSGEVFLTALRMAETRDGKDEPPRTPATRRADALVDICRFFLQHQSDRAGGRHRPHVNVIIEADDLYAARRARYESGAPVSESVAAQMLCDSVFHRVLVEPRGAILDFGRATRAISAPLWSALVVRRPRLPVPGLRPSGELVRGPPRGVVGIRRRDLHWEPRPALPPAPPPSPPETMARQVAPRRHLRSDRRPGPSAGDVAATRTHPLASRSARLRVARRSLHLTASTRASLRSTRLYPPSIRCTTRRGARLRFDE